MINFSQISFFKNPHNNSRLCHIHFKVLQYCIQEPRSWFSCFWKVCSYWLLQLCHQVYWSWVQNKWNAFFSKLIVSWFCTGKEFAKKFWIFHCFCMLQLSIVFPEKLGRILKRLPERFKEFIKNQDAVGIADESEAKMRIRMRMRMRMRMRRMRRMGEGG